MSDVRNFFNEKNFFICICEIFVVILQPISRKREGKMAEWSIASVLKTEVLKGTGGSNPSLSAVNE